MSLNDAVIGTIVFTRAATLKLVKDLTDEQLALQPAAKTNHAAWVLGHLIAVDYAFLGVLTGQAAPAWIDEAFKTKYGNKSSPVAGKENYQAKEWYLERLNGVHEQIVAKLKSMTPAEFDTPHPDPARRERFPTIGHVVPFYGIWHETYHSGQLSAWRRVLGLPAV